MNKKELDFILQGKEGFGLGAQNFESSPLGLSTSTLSDNSLRDLSPENMGHFNSNANAMYCTSFKCLEASFLAFGNEPENSDFGIRVICSSINSKNSSNSSPDNLDLLKNSSLCFSSSINKNSGATKSNLLNMKLSSNTFDESPFVNSEEKITLTSTTTSISNHFKYLLDNAKFTLSASSSTSSSANLDLATILCSRAILSNLDLITLLTTIDQFISETCLKNPISSGILIFNSAILTQEDNSYDRYLNVLKDGFATEKAGTWIKRIKEECKKYEGVRFKIETNGYFIASFNLKFPENVPEKRRGIILRIISKNNKITVQELANLIKTNEKTIKRDISKLKKDGILKRIGPDKGGCWKVKGGAR